MRRAERLSETKGSNYTALCHGGSTKGQERLERVYHMITTHHTSNCVHSFLIRLQIPSKRYSFLSLFFFILDGGFDASIAL